MGNNILTTVNDKPLKCIVTNNKHTCEYLKNTGHLIVLDETTKNKTNYGEDNDYREIYLSDYFLAGGRGVYTKEQQDTLIEIIDVFKDTIDDLNNTDNVISTTLQAKFDELNRKKLDISFSDEYDEYGQPYVVDGQLNPLADASNTYIQFESNNKKYAIRTQDIFKIISGIPEYKNIEILDIIFDV